MGGFFKTNIMSKNQYLMGQEYLLRLENECLIEKIAKIEKELGLKEKEIKDLRIQLKMVNFILIVTTTIFISNLRVFIDSMRKHSFRSCPVTVTVSLQFMQLCNFVKSSNKTL